MVCFDTNIVIYLAKRSLSTDSIPNEPIIFPSILRIEALGYSGIRSVEEQRIRELLETFSEIVLSDSIIEMAIRLRQQYKMSLGDAVFAATALENDSELWTANNQDFEIVDGLKVVNPLDQ